MKALVLAAGLGTRLKPWTDHHPKPLLSVGGRPLIHYPLLLLKRFGFNEVMINLHHLGDQIEAALGDGRALGLKISYSREPRILGTGGGIKTMAATASASPVLVVNGDILVDVDLDEVVAFHRARGGEATMVLREDDRADQWGRIEIDAGNRVRRILGRPDGSAESFFPRMFTGVHILEPQFLGRLPEGPSNIIDAYHRCLSAGGIVTGLTMQGYWLDLGTPERYQIAETGLQNGTIRLGFLEKRG